MASPLFRARDLIFFGVGSFIGAAGVHLLGPSADSGRDPAPEARPSAAPPGGPSSAGTPPPPRAVEPSPAAPPAVANAGRERSTLTQSELDDALLEQARSYFGSPIAWGDAVPEGASPAQVEELLNELQEACPGVNVLELDCGEYPCIGWIHEPDSDACSLSHTLREFQGDVSLTSPSFEGWIKSYLFAPTDSEIPGGESNWELRKKYRLEDTRENAMMVQDEVQADLSGE